MSQTVEQEKTSVASHSSTETILLNKVPNAEVSDTTDDQQNYKS